MKRKYTKDSLLIVSFIILIVLGFITTYFRNNELKQIGSRAVGDQVTVSFSPCTAEFPANQANTINVLILSTNQTKKISGIDMTFVANAGATITDILPPTAVGSSTTLTMHELVRSTSGNQARISYVFLNSDADLPSSLSVQLKVQGTGVGDVFFNTTGSQVVGTATGGIFDLVNNTEVCNYTFGGTISSAPTAGPSPTPTPATGVPAITVGVYPLTASQPLNQSFTESIVIDGQQAGQKVSAFELNLKVNPAIVRIDSVSAPIDNATGGDGTKFMPLINTFNAATGDIQLSYVVILPESSLPTHPKIDIQMTGISSGTSNVDVVSAQVTGNIAQNAYSVVKKPASITIGTGAISGFPTPTSGLGTPQPTQAVTNTPVPTTVPTITNTPAPTATRAPTPTPTPRMTLKLKLKFQGILKQPRSQFNKMQIQVTIGKEGFLSFTESAMFTADANGVWSGSVGFNDVDPDSGYRVYVKGPKHLQKRVCQEIPAETAPGTYRCGDGEIRLNKGVNNLDFSNIYLLVGDLPEQDGVQNGIVDAYDISYVRLNLGSKDSKALSVADLNLDGIVDTQDYSLIIASLSVKYDEL